jgi:hypothetical protein
MGRWAAAEYGGLRRTPALLKDIDDYDFKFLWACCERYMHPGHSRMGAMRQLG